MYQMDNEGDLSAVDGTVEPQPAVGQAVDTEIPQQPAALEEKIVDSETEPTSVAEVASEIPVVSNESVPAQAPEVLPSAETVATPVVAESTVPAEAPQNIPAEPAMAEPMVEPAILPTESVSMAPVESAPVAPAPEKKTSWFGKLFGKKDNSANTEAPTPPQDPTVF